MKTQPFWWRLLKHGSIFVLRVFGIFGAAAAGAAAASAARSSASEPDTDSESLSAQKEYGVHADGSPWYENSAHSQWELYHGER